MDSRGFLIKNATVISDGKVLENFSVLIKGEKIEKISPDIALEKTDGNVTLIDAEGKFLIPGVIDDHVHFREPGLTYKATINSETRAALAGGVTSFMDMPNTNPQTTTLETWNAKNDLAAQSSLINYAFYVGATNENAEELKKLDVRKVCGVKLFMGSSTGNMLVDNASTLSKIFAEVPFLIAVHCEDEHIIRSNMERYKSEFGENVPVSYHPLIRSEEACYKSTYSAIELANKYGTRLHVLHVTTRRELNLFEDKIVREKKITAETCPNYLWFDNADYEQYQGRIKCNPAIKMPEDKESLLQAINTDKIDVIGTDHAPHLLSEKKGNYFQIMSGCPSIQHSLLMLLELVKKNYFSYEKVVEKMCHNPALLYNIEKRGFIREGYYADLVLIDAKKHTMVKKDAVLYKCGWSPLEGTVLSHQVTHTFVNGNLAFQHGTINEENRGKALVFNN